MIQKVRVITKVGPDLKGIDILSDIHKMLGLKKVDKVISIKVYRLEGATEKQAKILAKQLLCEQINQSYSINKPFSHLPGSHLGGVAIDSAGVTIEIAYKPGVMNPEAASVLKAAKDLGIKLLAADSSYEYAFFGSITKEEIIKIVEKLKLYNPLIEHIVIEESKTLLIKGQPGKTNIIHIRDCSDKQLMEFSKDKLFLNLEEMKTIQKYFQKIKRDPTDVELETLAQTWSEHSGHKTFKADLIVDGKQKAPLIYRIKTEALKHKKNIVSAFEDNSGVMDFYDGWAINGKGETHNAPSSIEPYGGAMTGSGGVFRDVLATGQGAKNVISTDVFCFAPPEYPSKNLPAGTLPPLYLLKRVVAGVRDYGNRVGIPTSNGSVHFHQDFRARPTVLVGAYGIIPKKYAQKGKPELGDLIVVIGGKTGRDGIHGATFSSGEMTERTINVNSTAVQIGNAIEEKRVFDAILEARDNDLIRALQDCGGGGFSSSIGEIGESLGVTINLEKAPLKYPGLSPWEMWVSESQERMIIVLQKKNLRRFLRICEKYNVEASVIGKFDGSKKLNIYLEREKVCDLSMEFLHKGLPKKVLVARQETGNRKKSDTPPIPKNEGEWIHVLEKVLSHGNVCSKESIVRLYDHTVQGTSALPPFTGIKQDSPNDAVVIRPILDKPYGMIVSHGLNPVLNNIDPYWGSLWAATEAVANYAAVGGDYQEASLIENFIWPFPDEQSLWSLDQSVDAVVDFMKVLKIPVISGKDSLSSTYRGSAGVIKIPPVLCISVFGKLADVTKTISLDFKKVGSTIVLLGKQDLEMGGSTYFDVNGVLGDQVPKVDLKLLPEVLSTLHKAIKLRSILAAHDISEGGLITAIFEMCLGGRMGAELHLEGVKAHLRGNFLFNETAGCFIVEVKNEKMAEKLFRNLPYKIIGKTTSQFSISANGLFEADIKKLEKKWKKPMEEIFS
ncbi:phosphoribosylformylglycinamidine synthase subunit PurL [Candidatus Daviesbacteria bacterium]|nr:phosphoribosylformylglycinamidine synthase subunit PurL [Candidatus Daviesbacteria bacterium]